MSWQLCTRDLKLKIIWQLISEEQWRRYVVTSVCQPPHRSQNASSSQLEEGEDARDKDDVMILDLDRYLCFNY